MPRMTRLLAAIAVTAIAMPALAQDAKKTEQDKVLERTGNETRDVGVAKKKTPEQIAKEKATKDKVRADATKPATTQQEKVLKRTGDSTRDVGVAKKKTPEELAAEKAKKEEVRKSVKPEDVEKAKKASPG